MADRVMTLDKAFSLRGKIALVTGGGTGLGFAMSEAFLAAGARVAITGRRLDVLSEAVAGFGPSRVCFRA